MKQNEHLSRRRFALLAGSASVLPARLVAAAEPLTAEAVTRRILTELGGEAPSTPSGLDGFRAGDPSILVKGIAVTAMATLEVLKQAAKLHTNLVLTYEPTFYSRADGRAPASPGPAALSPDDPVFKAKREFIEKNGLAVFRLRDHWQARKENEMMTALATALGWPHSETGIYEIPSATAEATVASIRAKLNLRAGLRAVGDRKATIRRALLFPGSLSPAIMWKRYSEVDLIVAGEVREWENTHYAADIFASGEKRAFVTIGRVASEDPGMRACAEWLKTVVKEVPAKWIAVGDPYWRPA